MNLYFVVVAFLCNDFFTHLVTASELSPLFQQADAPSQHAETRAENLFNYCGRHSSLLTKVSKTVLCSLLPNLNMPFSWGRRFHASSKQHPSHLSQPLPLTPAESKALAQQTYIEDLAKFQDDFIRSQTQQPSNFQPLQPFELQSVPQQLAYSLPVTDAKEQHQHQQQQQLPHDMSNMEIANSMPFASIPSSNVQFPTQKTHFLPQQLQQFIEPSNSQASNSMPIHTDLNIAPSIDNNAHYQSVYPFPLIQPLAQQTLPHAAANYHMWTQSTPHESMFPPNGMIWNTGGWKKKRVNLGVLRKLSPKGRYKKILGHKDEWRPIRTPSHLHMPMPISIEQYQQYYDPNPSLIAPAVSLNPFLIYKALGRIPKSTVPLVITGRTTPKKVYPTLSPRPTTTPSPSTLDLNINSNVKMQKFTSPVEYSSAVKHTTPNPLIFPAKYEYSSSTTTESPPTTTKDYSQIVSEYLQNQAATKSPESDVDNPDHHRLVFRFNQRRPDMETIIDLIKARALEKKNNETTLQASETDSSSFSKKGFFEGILETDSSTDERNNVNSTLFDYDMLLNSTHLSVPGEPWLDYPMFSSMTATSFTCDKKMPGFYADVELKCQVYHHCGEHKYHQKFICPNGTLYDQQAETCNYWFNVVCGSTSNSGNSADEKSLLDDIYIAANENHLLQQASEDASSLKRIDRKTEVSTEPWLSINVGASIQVADKNPNGTVNFFTTYKDVQMSNPKKLIQKDSKSGASSNKSSIENSIK